ncbi:transcription factor bHLH68-like isoform X1 [Chenopodium quinoa]|uniref:transcription factor bHLH68-like isoform X1 n=1 Tax=Chenopodium quinoa TaxID=63459 RepID=UPI000B77E258|nr:transcription factor bHLH68-like isoform X1 [Chenopodium quinoa]
MMAGNPSNWWSMHSSLRSSSSASDHQHEDNLLISQTQHHHHQPSNNSNSLLPLQFLHGAGTTSSSSSSSLLPFIASTEPHSHDFPHSWSQLLLGGLSNEQEERFSESEFEATRVVNNGGVQVDVKEEVSSQSNNNSNNNLQLYGDQFHHEEQELSVGVSNRAAAAVAAQAAAAWSHHQIMPASLSPKSCITSLSSSNNNNNNNNSNSCNMLDFSTNNKRSLQAETHQHVDNHTTNSECNSTATTGGVPPKKPRVQSSSTPPLKVRKEKLGDRITALHQLVSPFGKTDTASVLLEAIGYIRFLQGQIEALSSPYLGNNNATTKNQHSISEQVHGERNCLFPDHPGQLLNDSCLKRRGAAIQDQDNKDASKDLKSRGLCLVPISCTQLVGSDNGADYWAQSLGGGF